MAEISLLAYVKYIEDRLARDAIQEVIAHCRHILEQYPKNLEVYRLFGKALLEDGDFHAASDIFQRVLSADPVDFWGHIGMSLTYQETASLDQAIWHMERAFEQAPNNEELQNEMKRLIKERDRVEPRKIQLTRGALARLYANGRLYQQAVAEITQALQEDPERLDLQVLLARSLWDSRQEIKAGKVAAEILRRLPYCIQANYILSDLWLHAGQAKEARPFLERVQALDPYLAYELEHEGNSAPSDAFRLTQFEWTPTAAAKTADAADWVQNLPVIEKSDGVTGPLARPAPSEKAETFTEPSSTGTPEWLQQVVGTGGVLPTLDPAVTPPPFPPVTDETPTEEPSTPPAGDAPDWLGGILEEPAPTTQTSDTDLPAWLSEAQDESASPTKEGAAGEPDWLDSVLSESTGPALPSRPDTSGEDIPDWLGTVLSTDTGAASPISAEEALPGRPEPAAAPTSPEASPSDDESWLDSLIGGGEAPSMPAVSPEPPAAGDGVLLDWLDEAPTMDEKVAIQEKDEALVAEGATGAPQEEEQVTEPTEKPTGDQPPEGEAPEWLASGDLDGDDAMAWLEGLAARQGASEEAFVTSAEDREKASPIEPEGAKEEAEPEPLPDWMTREADVDEEEEDALARMFSGEDVEEVEEPSPPASLEEPMPLAEAAPPAEIPPVEEAAPALATMEGDDADADEAMAWLEGLAARQGASEEAFVTSVEEREAAAAADKPEWLRAPTEELKPPTEEVAEERLPDWLGEPAVEAEEKAPAPLVAEEDTISWLDKLAEEQGVSADAVVTEALEADKPEPPVPAIDEDAEAIPVAVEELPDWLLGDTGAREEMEKAIAEPTPSDEGDIDPLARVEEEDLAWLSEALSEEEPAEDVDELKALLGEAEDEAEEAVPDWLRDEAPTSVAEAPVEKAEEVELPDWLRDESIREAEAPMDTLGAFLKDVEEPAEETPAPEPIAPPVAETLPPAPPQPVSPPVAETPTPAPVAEIAPGKPTGLLPEYEQKLSAEPEDYETRLALAREHLALGNYEESLNAYDELISSGQKLGEAAADLQDIIAGKRVRDPRTYRLLGDALMAQGRLQEALAAYRGALDRF